MIDSSTFVARMAPPFGKGGMGGVLMVVRPQTACLESPKAPLFQRGEGHRRAFGA